MGYREDEAERLREKIFSKEDSYEKDGVRYWRSNDAVIPPFCYEDAGLECPPEQVEAREAHVSAFIADYKKNQKAPSSEELFEMRAAFGPGTTVVDIVTGRRTDL